MMFRSKLRAMLARLFDLPTAPATVSNAIALWSSAGEFHVIDGAGNDIQITSGGSVVTNIRRVAAAFAAGTHTMLATDEFILYTGTGVGADKVALVAATGSGRTVTIKCTGAAPDLDLDGSGAETIDGDTIVTMSVQYQSITLVDSASGAWSII